ncbi:hypothetical protein Tco_0527681 [Tanacetum coccineum]
MAQLEFCDKHNMDFKLYSATIDGHEKLITEDSLRIHLKLDDSKKAFLHSPMKRYYKQLQLKTGSYKQGVNLSNFIMKLMVKNLLAHTNSYCIPEPIQPTHKAEETAFMPHDLPLHDVHSYGNAEGSMEQHDLTVLVNKLNDKIDGLEKVLQQTKKTYSTALTKLVLRVKKLEYKLKFGKARREAKIVLSDDKEIAEASSKQGKKISQIDEDLTISLVQDEGTSRIPQEEEVHENPSDETKMEISIANIQVSTASPPKVSTVVPHVYTRRSVKDKGKAIIEEPATLKKVKKRTQVQLSMDEELARKMEEEERIRFNVEQEARALQEEEERLNLEAARELQRQLDQRK